MLLASINDIFSNSADVVFFSAILAVIVILVVVFIVSKVVQRRRDKKYEKEFEERKAKELAASESSQNQTPENKPAEEPTEETPVEEAVEEPKEETPVEEAVEEPVEEKVKPAPKQTKKAPAKKTPAKKPSTKKAPAKKPVEKAKPAPVAAPKTSGRTYNGKFEVYPSGDGYQYRLKASNGEILVVSEVYTTHDGVLKAIEAVQRNVETGDIRIIEDKHGGFKFKLTSKNYRVLALGANYSTSASAVRASESFKKFALKANVVEIETPEDHDLESSPIEIVNTEDKDGGKYLVEKFNGEYSWSLKAANGQILVQAEGYTSRSGVLNSVETFKKNVENGSFKVVKDKSGSFHFKLYTSSGRVAAIGEFYGSKQLAESAANSVASYYKNSEVVEQKEENE